MIAGPNPGYKLVSGPEPPSGPWRSPRLRALGRPDQVSAALLPPKALPHHKHTHHPGSTIDSEKTKVIVACDERLVALMRTSVFVQQTIDLFKKKQKNVYGRDADAAKATGVRLGLARI